MSPNHRIWELVTMICQPHGQETAANTDTTVKQPQTDETVATNEPRTLEAEISRLTWAVLDGNASIADRHRLAELVSAQHEARSAS